MEKQLISHFSGNRKIDEKPEAVDELNEK